MTDSELLRRYVRERSERAFEELVRRRINLVYSAALRQVNNDTHLAEDVTQAVFTDLARKAAKLARHPSLTAWLYTSTRFAAANTRRAEHRRSLREREAHAMNIINTAPASQPDWSQIRPLLDDAMHTLEAGDREVLLLRHFEQRSYSEIGSHFGLAEAAARMRVNRALGKLRDELAKRGVTSTALAIATLLANNAVGAAPGYLAARVTRAAITGTAASSGLSLLLTAKIKLALAVLVIVAIVAIVRRNTTKTPTTDALLAATNAIEATAQPAPPSVIPASPAPLTNGAVLHLQIVTADTGQPIPVVPIEYFAWDDHVQKTIRTDRHGICDILYPRGITRLELVTEKGPFADTRLVWQPPLGDVIPSNYVLRVERAVPIGGMALDEDNTPVPGAIITWQLAAPNIAASKPSASNEYYGTTYETTADQAGRWQINRISEAIIPYLMGQAKEINHVDSPLIFTSRDKPAEKQLREGTYVFKLSRAATVTGTIVDTNDTPISDATITIGNRSAQTHGDGKFSIPCCSPEIQEVTAQAPGYLSWTMQVNIAETAEILSRVRLRHGKPLHLRIVDEEGNPIPNVFVIPIKPKAVDDMPVTWLNENNDSVKWTDEEGRAIWTNAPDTDINLEISAATFEKTRSTIHPNGQEHTIKLTPPPR